MSILNFWRKKKVDEYGEYDIKDYMKEEFPDGGLLLKETSDKFVGVFENKYPYDDIEAVVGKMYIAMYVSESSLTREGFLDYIMTSIKTEIERDDVKVIYKYISDGYIDYIIKKEMDMLKDFDNMDFDIDIDLEEKENELSDDKPYDESIDESDDKPDDDSTDESDDEFDDEPDDEPDNDTADDLDDELNDVTIITSKEDADIYKAMYDSYLDKIDKRETGVFIQGNRIEKNKEIDREKITIFCGKIMNFDTYPALFEILKKDFDFLEELVWDINNVEYPKGMYVCSLLARFAPRIKTIMPNLEEKVNKMDNDKSTVEIIEEIKKNRKQIVKQIKDEEKNLRHKEYELENSMFSDDKDYLSLDEIEDDKK